MIRTCYYNIEGFFPQTTPSRQGGCGFTIYLHPEITQKLLQYHPSDKLTQTLQDDAREITQSIFPEDYDELINPYNLFENSLLIQICKVPGNGCDLGADFEVIERIRSGSLRDLEFRPHNVDGFDQSSALLGIWLNWFNTSKPFVKKD